MGPSPKLKLTLDIVPLTFLPFAVKLREKGTLPDAVRSTLKLSQTGGELVVAAAPGWDVGVGVNNAVEEISIVAGRELMVPVESVFKTFSLDLSVPATEKAWLSFAKLIFVVPVFNGANAT